MAIDLSLPYTGKFWRGKILANSAINANLPNFFPANTYKDTETTEDLPLDLPKFSSPFASMVAIRQNFTPPKFSRVRYYASIILGDFDIERIMLGL